LVVLEGLHRLVRWLVLWVELGAQQTQVSNLVAHQASVQRGTRNVRIDELTRDDEQIVQRQQQLQSRSSLLDAVIRDHQTRRHVFGDGIESFASVRN
jgi:hypothetical protein